MYDPIVNQKTKLDVQKNIEIRRQNENRNPNSKHKRDQSLKWKQKRNKILTLAPLMKTAHKGDIAINTQTLIHINYTHKQ